MKTRPNLATLDCRNCGHEQWCHEGGGTGACIVRVDQAVHCVCAVYDVCPAENETP